MARKKNLTLEEQLEEINQSILTTEQSLESLRNEKKDLEEQLKKGKMQQLYEAIVSSGKNIDDIIKQLETA